MIQCLDVYIYIYLRVTKVHFELQLCPGALSTLIENFRSILCSSQNFGNFRLNEIEIRSF